MKLTTAFLSLLGLAAAAAVPAPVPQSTETPEELVGPFRIVSTSKDKNLDGLTLWGSHIGAGFSLARLGAPYENQPPLYLNTTYALPGKGRLVYPIRDDFSIVFQGQLQWDTSSDVAALLLGVGDPLYTFGIEEKTGEITIDGLKRWWYCTVNTPYGDQTGIVWKLGDGKPDDKKCAKIGLKKQDI
ncbi:hypothetical protein BJ508DRAFT_414155 [Ascobolus immersus RN42]|uniref:DUF7907 domain-containing protein n=1 Tax=Ascobolus immersus RN42 TaxID=1160509 RepID=A0A3N4I886_ASCIM|nr:hypothetical protein BJ508DRAFT_414155 [Ascobolus immersus RN42]